MFKKPLADLKTSAPLRSSDRRKLKQRVLNAFPVLQTDDGDVLVPDGLLAQKFSTYTEEPGIAYLSAEGDPLWFTLGKNSDNLIPTVYTLWQRPDLLPCLTTPSAVVPKLIGGADLMIPGVIQCPPDLSEKQLVSIAQYHGAKRGYPLAIGHMAVDASVIGKDDAKGKGVYVLHTWKDHLWDLGDGRKKDVPEPRDGSSSKSEGGAAREDDSDEEHEQDDEGHPPDSAASNGTADHIDPSPSEPPSAHSQPDVSTSTPEERPSPLTPEDVSYCLREALLQAISTTLSGLPPSSFPIPASAFWTSYILPARPAQALGTHGLAHASAIDVKQSSHKNVKGFLKACAKEGLVKLKEAKGGDVQVVAVFPEHPAVSAHRPHRTIREVELRAQKAEDRERKEKEAEEKRKSELQVAELWRPIGSTVGWIVAADKSSDDLYTLSDLKTILNTYIASKQLVNARDQQFINVADDDALFSAVHNKADGPGSVDFLKREEVLGRIKANMQVWHEIRIEGQEPIRKKGELKPISVQVKIRQGRKTATFITGFEPFLLDPHELADELRRLCASSTSVTPIVGKNSGMEVMVQGKQVKAVTDLLVGKGVPKNWIDSSDKVKKK